MAPAALLVINAWRQFKAIWIDMARMWLKPADLAEKNSRADLVCETPSELQSKQRALD